MTSTEKNVNIDKLDDKVNKYNNTDHRTNTMKPVDVKDNTYIDIDKESNNKDLKVVDHTKTSLLKDILQIGLKKVL